MTPLPLLSLGIVLFAAFLVVTVIESRQGVRVFGAFRARFDERLALWQRSLEHTDIFEVVRSALYKYVHHLLHDVVHLSLSVLHVLERALMRLRSRLVRPHKVRTVRDRTNVVDALRYLRDQGVSKYDDTHTGKEAL